MPTGLGSRPAFSWSHLLRFRRGARCNQHSLEHVEGLQLHLARRRRIGRYANDVAGGHLLLLAVDVEIDAFVAGRTDHANGQTAVGGDQRLVGIDVVGVLRRHDRIERGFGARKLGTQRREIGVLVGNIRRQPLAVGLQLLNGGVALRNIAGIERAAPKIAADHDEQDEDDGGRAAKPAARCWVILWSAHCDLCTIVKRKTQITVSAPPPRPSAEPNPARGRASIAGREWPRNRSCHRGPRSRGARYRRPPAHCRLRSMYRRASARRTMTYRSEPAARRTAAPRR